MIYMNIKRQYFGHISGRKSVILSLERIKEGLSLFTHIFAYCLNFLQQTCFYSVLASKTLKKKSTFVLLFCIMFITLL